MIWLDGNHSVYLQTPIRLYDFTSLYNLKSDSITNTFNHLEHAWNIEKSLPGVRKIINEWIITDPRVKSLSGGLSKYYIYLKGKYSITEHIFNTLPTKRWTGTRILQPRYITHFCLIPSYIGLKCLNYINKPKWPKELTKEDIRDIELIIRVTLCDLLENWETYHQTYSIKLLWNDSKKVTVKFSRPNEGGYAWGSLFCKSYITLYISHKLGLI